MGNISISYDEDKFLAILIGEDVADNAWLELRLLAQSSTSDAINLGDREIHLPWWVFLSIARDVGSLCSNYGEDAILSERALGLVQNALQEGISYDTVVHTDPIDRSVLLDKLKHFGFLRELTQNQVRNVSKLVRANSGATFSVPGAGKTTEALAFFSFKSSPESRLLIVCPKNAFPAWDEQVLQCIPGKHRIVRLVGTVDENEKALESNPRFVMINYHKLSNNLNSVAKFLVNNPDSFMFLDESHRIKKGVEGKHGASVLQLAPLARFKLIMSGTPLPNSITDINPQFEFIFPEMAGNGDPSDLIRPIFVRTTKNELGLPPVKRESISVAMGPAQKRLYDLYQKKFLHDFDVFERTKIREIRSSVMRLLQVVSNPAMVLSSGDIDFLDELKEAIALEDSPKVQAACNLARKIVSDGRKVIIWSCFVQNIEVVTARLADLGAVCIYGKTEAGDEDDFETREGKVKLFHQSKDCNVLVANPAACSEGISLHKVCHDAIYLDRNFNAAQYLQSEDRIHRFGLSKDEETRVFILHTPKTIDQVVSDRLGEKIRTMADILEDKDLRVMFAEDDEADIEDNEVEQIVGKIWELEDAE